MLFRCLYVVSVTKQRKEPNEAIVVKGQGLCSQG